MLIFFFNSMEGLDAKDMLILNELQKDCRISYTKLAKIIDLSVDSTKKRVQKLQKNGCFFPKVQLRPRHFGYPYIVDVKIKLSSYDEKSLKSFIDYLKNHPRVAEAIRISGEWDFTIVIFAKGNEDLARIGDEIRNKFATIISDWKESLSKVVYRFETYDLIKLKEYEESL